MKMVISFFVTFGAALISGCAFYESLGLGLIIAVIFLVFGGKSGSDYTRESSDYSTYRAPYSPREAFGAFISPGEYSDPRDPRARYANDYREMRRGAKGGKGKKNKNRNSADEARRAEQQWDRDFWSSRRYVPRS